MSWPASPRRHPAGWPSSLGSCGCCGCVTALRATYADSTQTFVATVGIAVLTTPAARPPALGGALPGTPPETGTGSLPSGSSPTSSDCLPARPSNTDNGQLSAGRSETHNGHSPPGRRIPAPAPAVWPPGRHAPTPAACLADHHVPTPAACLAGRQRRVPGSGTCRAGGRRLAWVLCRDRHQALTGAGWLTAGAQADAPVDRSGTFVDGRRPLGQWRFPTGPADGSANRSTSPAR